MWLGLIIGFTVGLIVGFRLGIDYQFYRFMSDPGIRFAIEMGRRMKENNNGH